MKICRFDHDRIGIVEGDIVRDVTATLELLPVCRYPLPTFDLLVAALGDVTAAVSALKEVPLLRLSEVTLRSPVANPGKLIGAPVNYQAHRDEAIADAAAFSREQVRQVEEVGLFLKATSSLVGAGEGIFLAQEHRRTDHEIELAAIIGKPCRGITRSDALSCVAGYSIGLDITLRGVEERSLRKSMDTYSVLGPWLVTADEFGDPGGREMMLKIDGSERQRANTRDLILDVARLIEFASAFYTLMPGDVIFTGTPSGVGPIRAGETITAAIEGIGEMSVPVRGNAP